MLEIFGIKEDNSEIKLDEIISLTVNQEENVPADDLSATLAYNSELPELQKIILRDNGDILFTGVVDEQQTMISNNGAYNRIIARSMAAVLLDNESVPVIYNRPSASVIFKYHIQPFGITDYKGDNKSAIETINIPKGSTNWQAAEVFCQKAFGSFPRVEGDGTINFDGIKKNVSIRFSNTDGIAYNSIKENKKKCKAISNVRVKVKPDGGYDMNIENKSISGSVKRERYLDASVSTASLDLAQAMIDNSNSLSYELELTSPVRLLNILGANASVSDSDIGNRNGLYVSSVFYRLTPDTEYTTIKLKKEN